MSVLLQTNVYLSLCELCVYVCVENLFAIREHIPNMMKSQAPEKCAHICMNECTNNFQLFHFVCVLCVQISSSFMCERVCLYRVPPVLIKEKHLIY